MPTDVDRTMPDAGDSVRSPYRMTGAVVLAWTGMYVHNIADLPNLTWSSIENVGPALIWALLYGTWWARPARSWPATLLLAWGMLNLVGGLATVLPLPVLPFAPEQSLRHYMFHVLYALTQLPVLAIAGNEFGRLRQQDDGHA